MASNVCANFVQRRPAESPTDLLQRIVAGSSFYAATMDWRSCLTAGAVKLDADGATAAWSQLICAAANTRLPSQSVKQHQQLQLASSSVRLLQISLLAVCIGSGDFRRFLIAVMRALSLLVNKLKIGS
jgi:hypothetical protein